MCFGVYNNMQYTFCVYMYQVLARSHTTHTHTLKLAQYKAHINCSHYSFAIQLILRALYVERILFRVQRLLFILACTQSTNAVYAGIYRYIDIEERIVHNMLFICEFVDSFRCLRSMKRHISAKPCTGCTKKKHINLN